MIHKDIVCKKCGNVFPMTSEFFYSHYKNGRQYFRKECIECSKENRRNHYKRAKNNFENSPLFQCLRFIFECIEMFS